MPKRREFDLTPAESIDLAGEMPDKLAEIGEVWDHYAGEYEAVLSDWVSEY